MDAELDSIFAVAALPAEMLQALGEHLAPNDLRSARLVCKSWATALAVCMPTMTMALPQQTSSAIFRQPLVLCSSGPLGSTQSASYTAVPRAPTYCPAPAHGTKPSPFATMGGQVVADNLAASSSSSNRLPKQSPFMLAAESLPPCALHRMAPVSAGVTAVAGAAATGPLHWQNSGVLQSWSSLPASGLRTCSSLQQLKLQLSGAPPSPEDLADLSNLPHLKHLSFKQVGHLSSMGSFLAQPDHCIPEDQHNSILAAAADSRACKQAAASSSGSRAGLNSTTCANALPQLLQPSVSDLANAAAAALASFHISSPMGASSSSSTFASLRSSSRGSTDSSLDSLVGENTAAAHAGSEVSAHSFWGSDSEDDEYNPCDRCYDSSNSDTSNLGLQHQLAGQRQSSSQPTPAAAQPAVHDTTCDLLSNDTAQQRDQGNQQADITTVPAAVQQCVSCSVLTPGHVQALAQLPYLSSLELQPTDGQWDAAGTAALLQLSMLTGLTKLSITWGSADAAEVPLNDQEAVQQAHGDQYALQQCLVGLGQLRELELRGSAVVDVQVIQRMQHLRRLTAEALKVVNSDVLLKIQQQRKQQGGGDVAVTAEDGAMEQVQLAAADLQQQQQQRSPKWATLPVLEHIDITHPASDISVLLQGTRTPVLSSLGFVARGSGDFAWLLSQHGRIRVLHLVFPEDQPWHTIAVVRLPTALPALTSLTLEGKFWLPNSLIVALGVMEVPLEELSLKCKLAVPCLDRLQYLRTVRKLGLHHIPVAGPPEGLITKDVMLQLPANLLPPGLKELEISNGWILR